MLRFVPEHPGAVAFLDGSVVRLGDVVDAPAEWVARISAAYVGTGGGPCLIPVESPAVDPVESPAVDPVESPAVDPVADFMAAISVPTPFNPETPPAAASSDKPEPVKRKPGRPRKPA